MNSYQVPLLPYITDFVLTAVFYISWSDIADVIPLVSSTVV